VKGGVLGGGGAFGCFKGKKRKERAQQLQHWQGLWVVFLVVVCVCVEHQAFQVSVL